jgi:hypothetical protein
VAGIIECPAGARQVDCRRVAEDGRWGRGAPLSRWGISFETGSNVTDVTVARLRSKLGEESIETVGNVGYRISTP